MEEPSGRHLCSASQVWEKAAQIYLAGRCRSSAYKGLMMTQNITHYRVLARKYRPKTFDDLIGQEALVQTLSNAISKNRLANAYILTGIRGVGKTSTARIIARALNCIGEDGKGSMTVHPCGKCQHCRDIENDNHMDVIEIDAASNTGVDNIREIIESAKYNPISARYKIYIIDEVHMLSKSAFNALLKTLEEPPEHLKFIFATTEIRKVPITILSRCQRFDLKRITDDVLLKHFEKIVDLEKVTAQKEALSLIVKAADGSVRDGLSLLDQAIVYCDNDLTADKVRQMMGISDKTALFDLYNLLMKGQMSEALIQTQKMYQNGVDSLTIAENLLEMTHWLTKIKLMPELLKDVTLSDTEKQQGKFLAENLSFGVLARTWQLLLKGVQEIKWADIPYSALEMLLIRLCYAAQVPTPLEIIQNTKSTTGDYNSLEDIINSAKSAGQLLLASHISQFVQPINIQKGIFHFHLKDGAPSSFKSDITKFLKSTGILWDIKLEDKATTETFNDLKKQDKQQKLEDNQLVQSLKNFFNDAEIEEYDEES